MREENKTEPDLLKLHDQFEQGTSDVRITVEDDLIKFGGKLMIGINSNLRQTIVEELHNSKVGGHSRYFRTLRRIRSLFYWKGMNRFVRNFLADCLVCQQSKYPTSRPLGLLQPLAIPSDV